MRFASKLVIGFVFTLFMVAAIAPASIDRVDRSIGSGVVASPAWPGLVRHAPVVVTSNADFATQGFTGTGVAGDRWLLENVLIECNASSSGIVISGTTDSAIVRNSFINETSGGALDIGIGLQTSTNVIIQNCTVEFSGNAGIAVIACGNVDVFGCTVLNSTGASIYIDGSWDVDVENSTFESPGSASATVFASNLVAGNASTRIRMENCSSVVGITTLNYINNADFVKCEFNDTSFLYCENVTFNTCNFTYETTMMTGLTNFTFTSCDFISTTSGIDMSSTGVISSVYIDACTYNVTTYLLNSRSDDTISIIGSNGTGGLVSLLDCTNVTIVNSSSDHSTNAIYSQDTVDILEIENNTIEHASGYAVYVSGTDDVIIKNNTVFSAGYGIYLVSSHDCIVTNNTIMHMMIDDAISITSSDRTTVESNYVYAPGNVTNAEAPTGLTVSHSDDTVIEHNTFVACNGTADGYGVGISGTSTNATIQFNWFIDDWFGVTNFGHGVVIVSYNWFKGTFNPFEENVLNSTTFERNYYFEYFDEYPYDIATNTTMIELDGDYLAYHDRSHYLDPPLYRNDTHPLYWAAWYPRSQVVNIRVYSNVDGQGVVFDNLKIYVDGVQIATASPIIAHVLFRLTIEDFKGRLLHDEVYNLNSSGSNLNIGVDIAVQIFFHFYSNIDYFGLDFTLIKLYIDGVRYTRFDPIMEKEIITVTVRDYANSILYNNMLNLSATGVYLDIGLDIAQIIIKNNFDETMTFVLAKGGVSIRYSMPAQSEIMLRLALGAYTYAVYYRNGTRYTSETADFTASSEFSISFGFVTTSIPVTPVTQTDMVTPVVIIIVAVCVLGVFGLASKFITPKRIPRRSKVH